MKIINKIIVRFLDKKKNLKSPVLRLETTNACNASCMTCPRPKMKRPVGTMKMELFQEIVRQGAGMGIKRVHLHNYGEPLLDKNLMEKISFARSKGLQVKIFTNASLLTRKKAEEIVMSGIEEIKISMDGVTKATFERIRKNLKFEDVVNGIENLIETRRDKILPRISLVLVSFDENRKEISLLKEKWKGRVDSVIVTHYHNWASENTGKMSMKQRLQKTVPCARLWKTITVLWDGRVALCCLDYDGEVILGDLKKETLQQIWKGK